MFKSSLVKKAEFQAGVLTVELQSGVVYEYRGVPEKVYNELVTAKSVGAYFNKNIVSVYPGTKI